MRSLPLRTKLIFLVAFMSAMLVTGGVLGLIGMKDTRASLETVYKNRLVCAIQLATIGELLSDIRREMRSSAAQGWWSFKNLPVQHHLVMDRENRVARI